MKDIVYFHDNSILPQRLLYKDLVIWPVRITDSGAELILNPGLSRPKAIKDACGKTIGQRLALGGEGEGIDLVFDFDENKNKEIEAHGSRYSLQLIRTTCKVVDDCRFFVAAMEIEEIICTAPDSADLSEFSSVSNLS